MSGPIETPATETATDAGAVGKARAAPTEPGEDFASVEIDPAHYEIEGELARGGMGRILRARDRRLDRPVAIKQLLGGGERARRLFEREVRITARLQHPAIVNIYEAGHLPGGELFYAMKLVAGSSLKDAVERADSFAERLGMVAAVGTVADALAYAHQHGIIHRDLKPSNVLVGAFGETVVVDWGLAKQLEGAPGEPTVGDAEAAAELDPNASVSGRVAGTPAYMPPEQARGEPVDRRADVYALGALMYHVLTGQPPYTGTEPAAVLDDVRGSAPRSLAEVEPRVPSDLVALVSRAMARDADERYPSAVEFREDLRRFQMGRLVGAHQYSRRELALRWFRRRRAEVVIAGVALAVLSVLSVLAIGRIVRERDVAASRADRLTLAQASLFLDRDPARTLSTLSTLSESSPDWSAARVLAQDARTRGIGHVELADTRVVLAPVALGDGAAVVDEAGVVSLVGAGSAPRLLESLGAPASLLVASRGGRWLGVAGDDGSLRLVRADGSRPAVLVPGHRAPITRVAFGRDDTDGISGVSGDSLGAVRAWSSDAPRGVELSVHAGAVTCVAIDPTGARVASADRTGSLHVIERAGGTRRVLRGAGVEITELAFWPDDQHLLVGDRQGGIWSWPLDAAAPTRLATASGAITALLADGSSGMTLLVDDGAVWQLGASGQAQRLDLSRATSIARVGDGQLAVGQSDGMISLIEGGSVVQRFLGHAAAITGLTATAGGSVVSASEDHTVRSWRRPATSAPLRGHTAWVSRVVAAGDHFVSTGWDGTIRVWSEPTARVLRGHAAPIRDVAVSADGAVAVTVADDRTLRSWQLPTGAQRILGSHQATATSVALASDGSWAASGGDDNVVRLFELDESSGVAPRVLTGHRGSITEVAIDPRGRFVATASTDGTTRVWDRAGELVRVLEHREAATTVAFSPDGERVASAGRDGVVWIADVRGGRARALLGHQAPVRDVSFSSDGRRLLTASDDRTARVWDLSRDSSIVLAGHRDFVTRARFAPGDAAVATASEDGTARVWDARGVVSRVLDAGHWLGDLAWASDGSSIAAVGASAEVSVWPDDLPDEPAKLRAWLSSPR